MEINTRLGWECPEEYLVYDAETDLGYASNRDYYKTSDGYAFAFYYVNNLTGGHGPLLISTEAANVEYYYGSTYIGASFSFKHLNRTWYVNNQHYLVTSDYGTGVLIPIEVTSRTDAELQTELPTIMDSIGVKPYVSWKGISFIAGLAAGFATRAWAYMGEITMGLISKFITRNGTYNAAAEGADGFSSVVVNVPNTYELSDEGKVVSGSLLVNQTETTKTSNGTYDTTLNNSVIINVANSYEVSDEGKVVNGGTLVAQTSSIVSNIGVYDTTLFNSVTVSIPLANGEAF